MKQRKMTQRGYSLGNGNPKREFLHVDDLAKQ